MSTRFDLSDPAELVAGLKAAAAAITAGDLVVVPTDTVYGIVANGFSSMAVRALLDVKRRTRQAPPPVLVPDKSTLDELTVDVPEVVRHVVDKFWPGALTIIFNAHPAVQWDLGETHGTVGLRMPRHDVLLNLLRKTGPLAVSSANHTGEPAALAVDEAQQMLGSSVSVYLDGGRTVLATEDATRAASTIVDVAELSRGGPAHIIRHGPVPDEALAQILGPNLLR